MSFWGKLTGTEKQSTSYKGYGGTKKTPTNTTNNGGRAGNGGVNSAANKLAIRLANERKAQKVVDDKKAAEQKRINDAAKANEAQKRKAAEAVRIKAQQDKARAEAAKAKADKKEADKAVSDRREPVSLVETTPLAPSNIIRMGSSIDEFGETFDNLTTTPKENIAKSNDVRRNRTYSTPIAATEDAAIEAESKRMLAESEQLTALTDKKVSGVDEAQEAELFAQVTQDQENNKLNIRREVDASTSNELSPMVRVDDISTNYIDLSNFEDLGYASEQQAYQAYQDMSPEAKSIFDSLHNPSTKQKVGQGLIGALIPGASLISRLANYVGKSGSMKDQIERAERTVVTLQNNKDNPPINQGQDNDSQPVRSLASTTPPVEPPESTYSGVSAYTEILGNYKF